MDRIIVFAYGLFSYGLFFAAFLYLIGFLGNLFVPKGIDDGMAAPTASALLINLCLVALFGLQHSVMARPAFKRWLERFVPPSVERSTFVLATSLVLCLMYWQWRPMTQVIWHVEDTLLVAALWGVFAAGFLLVLLSTFVIDHFDLFGLRQVTLNLLQRRYTHPPFQVTYFYKFIRHPIYLGLLLAFWAAPDMTLGRLIFALGMSAYIFIGVRYEERDMQVFLGDDYRRYRERVPMLVPMPGKVHESVAPPATAQGEMARPGTAGS
jgi:protein-S-isoprenylcysteine O-methyltransferase Ste14